MTDPRISGQLSRRAALGTLGAAAAAASAPVRAATGTARPNILWLVSEDNNPYIGAYGDRLAHTPTIDALAAKGVLFRKVYANAPVCAPSRFGILTGIFPESCAPANQMRATARLPKHFRTYPELLRGAGYFCTNNAKTDYNCDVDAKAVWDAQGREGHWRQRPAGKPFMAVFNHETTHESQLFRETPGRVTPDMVTLPPYLPDTPAIRQDFASYHNLIEKMDGQLAARLAELEADGLAEDTIVFHYSDNGGVLPRSKRYCNEEGLRCELVVYCPPKWQHLLPAAPGGEVRSPVSFIDLAPTVLALAGVAQPPQMRGRPLLGRRAAPQKYAFGMRNRMDERIDFQRTVTDGRWRYIRNYMPHRPLGRHQGFSWQMKSYQDWHAAFLAGTLNPVQAAFFRPRAYEELYDLAADPHEIANLAGSPAARAKLAELSKALDAHMLAINDNGFLQETMAGEGWFESRDQQVYPLKRVMALAAKAARGRAQDLPALRAALADPLPVLRYWAATGLLIRGMGAAAARAELGAAMANDPSPLVRIVCAEALCGLGAADEAVPVLAGVLDGDGPWQVRLHAIEALGAIGEAARPARAAIERAATGKVDYLRNSGRYLGRVLDGTFRVDQPVYEMDRLMAGGVPGAK